jgi:hypothetical protein
MALEKAMPINDIPGAEIDAGNLRIPLYFGSRLCPVWPICGIRNITFHYNDRVHQMLKIGIPLKA